MYFYAASAGKRIHTEKNKQAKDKQFKSMKLLNASEKTFDPGSLISFSVTWMQTVNCKERKADNSFPLLSHFFPSSFPLPYCRVCVQGEGHFSPKNLVHLWQTSFCFQQQSIKNPFVKSRTLFRMSETPLDARQGSWGLRVWLLSRVKPKRIFQKYDTLQ